MFKVILVIYLLLNPATKADESLDESVRNFACSMNTLSMGVTESASGGALDCSDVRPFSGGNANFQQAPGFGRWLKLQFCSLIGGCVRRMSLTNQDNNFLGEECSDFESLPINISDATHGDRESCLWSIYYDIWYSNSESERITSLMNCERIICDEQVMYELKAYLSENNINSISNPEEYFGCVISI